MDSLSLISLVLLLAVLCLSGTLIGIGAAAGFGAGMRAGYRQGRAAGVSEARGEVAMEFLAATGSGESAARMRGNGCHRSGGGGDAAPGEAVNV